MPEPGSYVSSMTYQNGVNDSGKEGAIRIPTVHSFRSTIPRFTSDPLIRR
jgi:hypothetical protein